MAPFLKGIDFGQPGGSQNPPPSMEKTAHNALLCHNLAEP
jgi:hypothetical protein